MGALALQLRDQMDSIIVNYTPLTYETLNEFTWDVGTTPMSSIYYPSLIIILYCVGIPLLGNFMSSRSTPPLKYIIICHNLFLCMISLFLSIYLILNIYSFMLPPYNHKFMWGVFCGLNYSEQTGRLSLIYYINYLLKYYELLDTIFLTLKHKSISFLHGYHHPATIVLCWCVMTDSSGGQWMVIMLNLWVHTVMYFYYFMSILRIKMPWKKVVTWMQIIQFIVDVSCVYTATIANIIWAKCYGAERCRLVGCFILTSYLYLFIDFYNEAYSKKKQKRLKNKKDQ